MVNGGMLVLEIVTGNKNQSTNPCSKVVSIESKERGLGHMKCQDLARLVSLMLLHNSNICKY